MYSMIVLYYTIMQKSIYSMQKRGIIHNIVIESTKPPAMLGRIVYAEAERITKKPPMILFRNTERSSCMVRYALTCGK